MKFDYIVGNPPYDDGISKGLQKNLHLKCIEKCLNIFTSKMIIVMPIKFIQNNSEKLKYFKNIFNNTLKSVKEYNSNYFVGTGMPNVAVYEFDKNKKYDDCIEIQYINNNIIKIQSLLNNNYDSNITEILSYLETDKNYMNWLYLGSDKNNLFNSYNNQINIKLPKQNRYKNLIKSNNPSFIVCNAANGGMTGTYFTQKTNYVCEGSMNLINYLINRGGAVATILYFNNLICANNCKLALERPLLRFACYISQIDQNMKGRVYKYIPAIDWEDERCLTDEGILEMCGCPKDKAKEYAEYVKNYVEERDKEIENKKKRKIYN